MECELPMFGVEDQLCGHLTRWWQSGLPKCCGKLCISIIWSSVLMVLATLKTLLVVLEWSQLLVSFLLKHE